MVEVLHELVDIRTPFHHGDMGPSLLGLFTDDGSAY